MRRNGTVVVSILHDRPKLQRCGCKATWRCSYEYDAVDAEIVMTHLDGLRCTQCLNAGLYAQHALIHVLIRACAPLVRALDVHAVEAVVVVVVVVLCAEDVDTAIAAYATCTVHQVCDRGRGQHACAHLHLAIKLQGTG
eukprot:7611-Heterococcus_DN1.PRE.1